MTQRLDHLRLHADPSEEGLCRSELCNVENTEADIARMSKGASGEGANVQELGSLQRTFAQAAGVTDVDELMARLLHGAGHQYAVCVQLPLTAIYSGVPNEV